MAKPIGPIRVLGLRADLASARILVWALSPNHAESEVELTAGSHLYFADRYARLADYHRRRGHAARAMRLQAIADEHHEFGGGDGPPYAAAMGMPRPRHWFRTNAIAAAARPSGPDEAA